jgi:predicted phosphate transport protein (TIGR00153 family)
MRLDRIIQALLPHDERFYSFFEESTQILQRASELLRSLPKASEAERKELVSQMREFEHQCDNVTHKIYAELNSTFVTPFDREDIHLLASALDDIMDYMYGSAGRFMLYKLNECPEGMVSLIEVLHMSVVELLKGVPLLRDFRHPEQLQKILEKVNEYENDADSIFEQSIANLFEREGDPIQIIKMKEIFVSLETATDKCEDVANVLETLLIKHA